MLIRATAQAIIRRGGDILVFEAVDKDVGETFYRPLGGGIEFGERAEQALRRELREELNAELAHVAMLGVLENIFQFQGRAGHEIVFVFEAGFADPSWYEKDGLGTVLDGAGEPVSWQPLSRFVAGEAPLYPAGLLALLGAA